MKFLIYQKTGTTTTKGPYGSCIASVTWDIRRYFASVEADDDNFVQALARAKEQFPAVSGLGVTVA